MLQARPWDTGNDWFHFFFMGWAESCPLPCDKRESFAGRARELSSLVEYNYLCSLLGDVVLA